MSLLVFFSHVSTVLLVINTLLYLKYLPSKDAAYRWFSMYLICMAVNQLAGTILFSLHIENLFLANTYLILQFITLSIFYYAIFKGKEKRKYILVLLTIILTLLGVQYAWTPDLFFKYNTIGIIITSTVLISYAIIYFFSYISDKFLKLYLVNSGILIYLLGTILLFSIANVGLKLSKSVDKALWILNAIIYTVFQIIILVQWIYDFKKKKTAKHNLS